VVAQELCQIWQHIFANGSNIVVLRARQHLRTDSGYWEAFVDMAQLAGLD
jgi:hypothetical protein